MIIKPLSKESLPKVRLDAMLTPTGAVQNSNYRTVNQNTEYTSFIAIIIVTTM